MPTKRATNEKPPTEGRFLAQGLLIGTLLGLLVGAALIGATGDWSWLAFALTLGWAMGIGIALHWNPAGRRGGVAIDRRATGKQYEKF